MTAAATQCTHNNKEGDLVARIYEQMNEISTLAEKLKREDADLDTLLQIFDRRLARDEIETPIWSDPWFSPDDDRLTPHDILPDKQVPRFRAWKIGYAEIAGHWRLAVKQIEVSKSSAMDRYGTNDLSEVDVADPVALGSAPRHVRREAAEHITTLLSDLTEELESTLALMKGLEPEEPEDEVEAPTERPLGEEAVPRVSWTA